MEQNNMGANKSIKVIFRAFDQTQQELIFPGDHKLCDVANYLRNIFHTYIVLSMTPTSKEPNV